MRCATGMMQLASAECWMRQRWAPAGNDDHTDPDPDRHRRRGRGVGSRQLSIDHVCSLGIPAVSRSCKDAERNL